MCEEDRTEEDRTTDVKDKGCATRDKKRDILINGVFGLQDDQDENDQDGPGWVEK